MVSARLVGHVCVAPRVVRASMLCSHTEHITSDTGHPMLLLLCRRWLHYHYRPHALIQGVWYSYVCYPCHAPVLAILPVMAHELMRHVDGTMCCVNRHALLSYSVHPLTGLRGVYLALQTKAYHSSLHGNLQAGAALQPLLQTQTTYERSTTI